MKGQWLNNALAIVLVAWSRKIDASMVSVVVARHNCCRRVAPITNRKDMMTDSLPLPPSLRLLAGSLVFSVSLSAACLAAPPGESPWVTENFSKARLVSGTVGGADKGELLAGVQIRLEPGWKTYWRTPGDFRGAAKLRLVGIEESERGPSSLSGAASLRRRERHGNRLRGRGGVPGQDHARAPWRAGRAQAQCRLRSMQDAVHSEPGKPQPRASAAHGRQGR